MALAGLQQQQVQPKSMHRSDKMHSAAGKNRIKRMVGCASTSTNLYASAAVALCDCGHAYQA
jgi:hypothetical protein